MRVKKIDAAFKFKTSVCGRLEAKGAGQKLMAEATAFLHMFLQEYGIVTLRNCTWYDYVWLPYLYSDFQILTEFKYTALSRHLWPMANGSSCCQPRQRPPWPKRVASRVSNVRVGTGEMRSSIGGGEKIYDSFVKDHVVGLDRFGWCMQVVILLFYYKLILKLAQSFCFYTLKDLNPFFTVDLLHILFASGESRVLVLLLLLVAVVVPWYLV